jgi:hypothetical protein
MEIRKPIVTFFLTPLRTTSSLWSMTMRAVWLFAFQSSPSSILLRSPSKRHRLFSSSTTIMSASATTTTNQNLVVDPFCFRQFAETDASNSYGGTVFAQTIPEFEDIVNALYDEKELKDGYAPFCKHLFVKNDFTQAKLNVLPLSKDNEHLVRTEYNARNDKELPVLQRWIPLEALGGSDNLPVAKYLDLILYSRDQIQKETASMGKEADAAVTAPWGIVSIKAQDVDYELPMNPITVMRNGLGKDQGGSGIPITREAYMESVNYWKDHVVVT